MSSRAPGTYYMPLKQSHDTYNILVRQVSLPYTQPDHQLPTIDVELHTVYNEKPLNYRVHVQQWFDSYIEDKHAYRPATHKDLIRFISWLFK